MSDTTSDGTRTMRAVPTTEPLTELTGAPAAIYTELTRLTEAVTAAELALAARVGRSTAGKALTTLEERGLAIRIPGGYEGHRRTPDHWHAPNTRETTSGDNQSEPATPQSEPSSTAPDPAASGNTPADETAPDTAATPDDGMPIPATSPTVNAPQDTEHSGGEHAPTPQANAERQAAPAAAIPVPGGKKRLAPGALRQMVIEHLEAHSGEAFTAPKISRVIERSSGAIANALVALARQGIAEQVTDRPRTYRAATAPTGTE